MVLQQFLAFMIFSFPFGLCVLLISSYCSGFCFKIYYFNIHAKIRKQVSRFEKKHNYIDILRIFEKK